LILPAMRRMGFPLPLGGTSLFFRRRALERLGAWDAWNVTEDADLGLRLARAGYETGLIDSDTQEEAVSRPWAWIRQRSRWQKGYVHTWVTHMRRPWRLWRELGTVGFLGFQAHFIGAASAFLGQPLLWSAWFAWSFYAAGFEATGLPPAMVAALLLALHAGQVVMLAGALVALRRAGRMELAPCALTLPFYWPLATLSAVKSLVETVAAPMWWDKTEHGAGLKVEAGAPTTPSRRSPSSGAGGSPR
ncbi:MAG: glycosyltransferase family 2 protein, partial [Pseudomonadota bacterium]|nr:glycosyltransferase family 2 protein [Pseudomonadota bacterium]